MIVVQQTVLPTLITKCLMQCSLRTWGIIKGFLSFFPRCNVSQVFKIESLEYIFYDGSKYIPKAFGFTVLYKMTIHCMFSKNKERLRFNLVEHKKFKMHVPF